MPDNEKYEYYPDDEKIELLISFLSDENISLSEKLIADEILRKNESPGLKSVMTCTTWNYTFEMS